MGQSWFRGHVKLGGSLPRKSGQTGSRPLNRKWAENWVPGLRDKTGQEERRELAESEKGSGSGNTGQRLPHMGPITRTGGQDLGFLL